MTVAARQQRIRHRHKADSSALLATALTFATLMACGCRSERVLLFHAGAGQRSSLTEIEQVFAQRHRGVRANFSFKGSGYFLADLTRSRQGDLYMPGEELYFLQAVERDFIEDYRPGRDVAAHFVTVLITPAGNPAKITGIVDLARPGVKVGLGNPKTCAIGMWHEKTFQRAGIWEAVQRNATFSAKCIPELGNAVQHGLVDATVVWSSTAVLYLRDVEIIPIEPRLRGVVRLPVGVLKFARQPSKAHLLKDLILSEEGRAIFASHAYAAGPVATDPESFLAEGEQATEPLMQHLMRAAAAVKAPSWTPKDSDVGPLVGEVTRQRKTVRAGN
jgi:molybdate transport system substrate-binding protein